MDEDMEIHLESLSTPSLPHPQALEPVISFPHHRSIRDFDAWVRDEILLVFALSHIYVYHWMAGKLVMVRCHPFLLRYNC